jgi:hypothetical protein
LLRRILGSDAFRRRAPVFNTVALAASGDATAQDTEVRAIVVLDPGNNARLPLRRNWSGIGRGEPLIFGWIDGKCWITPRSRLRLRLG